MYNHDESNTVSRESHFCQGNNYYVRLISFDILKSNLAEYK